MARDGVVHVGHEVGHCWGRVKGGGSVVGFGFGFERRSFCGG